ncbi:Glycogen phosphorylase 1 [Tritrichomonas foetus]|uniref:Alpha-1,4 glucan phosphorylase n=1 Tax=Tritrichomonas foetus TaxID=1144522 RepID=A0A1J4L354_9EUKA|nr:Glycogen phosphorylase 1 [Tritrichomonas foetus]|eukprot:OHT16404.1 Glycogen phosphorylase 1 [Tritrichomonas foetus]
MIERTTSPTRSRLFFPTSSKHKRRPSFTEDPDKYRDYLKEKESECARTLLWKLSGNYISNNKETVIRSIFHHAEFTLGTTQSFTPQTIYNAISYSIRDRLIEQHNDVLNYFISNKVKQAYFVSIEFLLGRFLRNALLNLNLEDLYRQAALEFGFNLDDLFDEELEVGIGRGGLGRLAACFLDSCATCEYPVSGYGLCYTYGMFKQTINDEGEQVEIPDYWLANENPWMIKRDDIHYLVGFYGTVKNGKDWEPGLTTFAVANDFLIPGYSTKNTLMLRLWSSHPTSYLDEEKFRNSDYDEMIKLSQKCEKITTVLYPNVNIEEGKEMKLMQEYFLSCATIQDILHKHKNYYQKPIHELPNYAAIQLNDTHPVLMTIELLRILIDIEHMNFDNALEITRKIFSFTCHTLLSNSIEKWPVPLFQKVLPRHLHLIYELNQKFLDEYRSTIEMSDTIVAELSIIEESTIKQIRMSNIAVIICNKVNAISKIHKSLMLNGVYETFSMIYPDKFKHITNGVSIRRWLNHCNQPLSNLISNTIGSDEWITNPTLLTQLNDLVNDDFIDKYWQCKLLCKKNLSYYIENTCGIHLEPKIQLFDVQAKPINEYKRQSLLIFYIIHKYFTILDSLNTSENNFDYFCPRAFIIAGKADISNKNAKSMIKLISNVSRIINSDTRIKDLMKVVFIPNYNVSVAELVIPGSDTNEQISLIGTEPFGTSNMKFAFNGSLIIGTRDGSNNEITNCIGEKNSFYFGTLPEFLDVIRESTKEMKIDPYLKRVFDSIKSGYFGDPTNYEEILKSIEENDFHWINYEFSDYIECQNRVDELYTNNRNVWAKMCIESISRMGTFSSDRAINEYAKNIWKIKKCQLPNEVETPKFSPQIDWHCKSIFPAWDDDVHPNKARRNSLGQIRPIDINLNSNSVIHNSSDDGDEDDYIQIDF